MLKRLYAGNAFDECTYIPCSAALDNVYFLSISVALQVISKIRALANTPLLYAKSGEA